MKQSFSQTLLAVLMVSNSLFAQAPPGPKPPAPLPPVTEKESLQETEPPAPVVRKQSNLRESFPNLNLYFPEGEVDIRARRLIKNVQFESQINYEDDPEGLGPRPADSRNYCSRH